MNVVNIGDLAEDLGLVHPADIPDEALKENGTNDESIDEIMQKFLLNNCDGANPVIL